MKSNRYSENCLLQNKDQKSIGQAVGDCLLQKTDQKSIGQAVGDCLLQNTDQKSIGQAVGKIHFRTNNNNVRFLKIQFY